MATIVQPTLQNVLLGYQRFNRWQEEEDQQRLPQLTIAESLEEFFELCDLVRAWRPAPELELQWLEEERAPWVKLVTRSLTKG